MECVVKFHVKIRKIERAWPINRPEIGVTDPALGSLLFTLASGMVGRDNVMSTAAIILQLVRLVETWNQRKIKSFGPIASPSTVIPQTLVSQKCSPPSHRAEDPTRRPASVSLLNL